MLTFLKQFQFGTDLLAIDLMPVGMLSQLSNLSEYMAVVSDLAMVEPLFGRLSYWGIPYWPCHTLLSAYSAHVRT